MRREDGLERFRTMIEASDRIVFFTGAGISTESGIPDFRSAGTGIWNKIKPIEFQEFIGSESVRRKSWERKFGGDRTMERAKPNKGHEAVAKVINEGNGTAVITQNVDNLHQLSGVDDDNVIELHGNAKYAKCLSCDLRFELADLEQQFRSTGNVAPCSSCGGIVKTATISFGQPMPEDAMRRADVATFSCDLFIVIGSSLVVYPAAGFPQLAKRNGAQLVIVNREPTPLDDLADLVIHEEIGPTLSFVVGIN